MPVCKQHGMWPCVRCVTRAIQRCELENIERAKNNQDMHDIDGLKKELARIESSI